MNIRLDPKSSGDTSEKDDKNSSWFKSLKRNLSSKKHWGKLAKSGGNISAESSVGGEGGGSRRIKSEWDICDDDEGEQRPGVTDYDNLGVVSGLDLAHRKHRARQPSRGIYVTTYMYDIINTWYLI